MNVGPVCVWEALATSNAQPVLAAQSGHNEWKVEVMRENGERIDWYRITDMRTERETVWPLAAAVHGALLPYREAAAAKRSAEHEPAEGRGILFGVERSAKPLGGELVTAEMLAEMSKPGMIFNNDATRGASVPPKPLRVVGIRESSADYDLAVLELSDGRNAALDGRLARACGLRSRHDAALADEMGSLRTENTGLLADNARLRRKLEDAERKLSAATRKKGPWER